MNKLKYVLDSFNIKFDNLVKAHGRYSRFITFVDFCFSAIKYGCSPADYFEYEFYDKKSHARKEFCCNLYKTKFFKKMNNDESSKFFSNKRLFLEKFDNFVKRDWLDLSTCTINDCYNFCKKHNKFIIKPINLSCGRGIKIINLQDDIKRQFNELKKDGCIVEEVIMQHPKMAELHSASVNTIRVATCTYKNDFQIIGCVLRCGSGSGCIDNYCAGGFACKVDPETGIVISDGINESQVRYYKHPTSNVIFHGFQIPHWNKVIEIVKEAAKVVPEVQYVGWDIAVRENDVCIIEGNDNGMFNLLQAPANQGIKNEIKMIMNK